MDAAKITVVNWLFVFARFSVDAGTTTPKLLCTKTVTVHVDLDGWASFALRRRLGLIYSRKLCQLDSPFLSTIIGIRL